MDSVLYTKLSTDTGINSYVSGRVYPVWPEYDAQLPLILYARVGTEDQLILSGPCGLLKYDYQLDVWAINADTAGLIADAVYASLKSWHTAPTQGAFLTSDLHESTDIGYHIQATYSIWGAF